MELPQKKGLGTKEDPIMLNSWKFMWLLTILEEAENSYLAAPEAEKENIRLKARQVLVSHFGVYDGCHVKEF